MASAQAAAFQHIPAVTRRHTGAESVYAHTAANFWLIGSLCRHRNSFQKSVRAAIADIHRYFYPYFLSIM